MLTHGELLKDFHERQTLKFLLGLLVAPMVLLGLIVFGPKIVGSFSRMSAAPGYGQYQEPQGCLDSLNVQVYQTANFVDLYTAPNPKAPWIHAICAWKDSRGLHLVEDKAATLSLRKGYLMHKYSDLTLSCDGKSPPRPAAEIHMNADAVCMVACGRVIDCGEANYAVSEDRVAMYYQDELNELIRRKVAPLP